MPPVPIFSVEESVPANVSVPVQASVLPLVIVRTPVDVVIVKPLMLVAVATPNTGVVRFGDVALTPEPVPVVVIASKAVAPALTAMIFEPLPAIVGSKSNPASMRLSSDRKAEDDPAALLAG